MNVAISQKLHWWKRSGQRRRYGDCNLFLCRRRRSGAAQWVESESGCGILKTYHSSSWWWSDGCHQCPQKLITNSSTTSGFHISSIACFDSENNKRRRYNHGFRIGIWWFRVPLESVYIIAFFCCYKYPSFN